MNLPALRGWRATSKARWFAGFAVKLLARLSAEDRLVLTLLDVEGFSVAEIADMTNWSVSKC